MISSYYITVLLCLCMFKPERDMQYVTSVWLVYIPLQKSLSLSLTHFLALSLSLALSSLSYLFGSSDVIAHSTLTSTIGFPAALVVWLPKTAWLIVHIGHHCPISWLCQQACHIWLMPLRSLFYLWWKGFRDEVNVSNLRSPQGESQSYIFNLETCCAVCAGAIPHPAGVNVTEAIWGSSKRTHFFTPRNTALLWD